MTTIYLPHEEFGQEKTHLELVFGQINTMRYCLTSEIKLGLKVVTGRNYEADGIKLFNSLTLWYVWKKTFESQKDFLP